MTKYEQQIWRKPRKAQHMGLPLVELQSRYPGIFKKLGVSEAEINQISGAIKQIDLTRAPERRKLLTTLMIPLQERLRQLGVHPDNIKGLGVQLRRDMYGRTIFPTLYSYRAALIRMETAINRVEILRRLGLPLTVNNLTIADRRLRREILRERVWKKGKKGLAPATPAEKEYLAAEYLLRNKKCKTIEEVRKELGRLSRKTEKDMRELGYH